MKRMREPSERKSKKKTQKLGEPSVSRPPVPLVSSSPCKFQPYESPTLHIRQLYFSLPQPSPIYTDSEPTTSTTNPFETHTSNPPSPPLQHFNLTTTTLPIFEALLFNEPISRPSSTLSSQSYYNISSDSDQPEASDPQSPTLAQLQAHSISTQNPSKPETSIHSPYEHPTIPPSEPHTETPSKNLVTQTSDPPIETILTPPEPILPTVEPKPTFPTLEEAIALFVEEAGERLQARLAREEKERARREAKEKARLEEEEKARREAAEKDPAEVVAAAEAEAKAKPDAEEAARIAAEEASKAKETALTQGESSHSIFAPLLLKALKELQKEQQIVRARLDQQDSVKSNI
ncbi:eukaryotic translation initiation factor 4 gamma-like [Lathyrus oleraceus]|uniref:eukaryotic translation initiation factor 4 gamma-like n=1 Tax=Pisum sativum TaxID=3888 RepID=UPI0021D2449D|nr:eukaryotic translation initiation factor 4 gamma-like [Pisum sativum]